MSEELYEKIKEDFCNTKESLSALKQEVIKQNDEAHEKINKLNKAIAELKAELEKLK